VWVCVSVCVRESVCVYVICVSVRVCWWRVKGCCNFVSKGMLVTRDHFFSLEIILLFTLGVYMRFLCVCVCICVYRCVCMFICNQRNHLTARLFANSEKIVVTLRKVQRVEIYSLGFGRQNCLRNIKSNLQNL